MADKSYYIYLGYNNQAEGWRIPVNPESIEIKEEGQGKTYNIVGKGGGTEETRAGEVNVIKSPKLKEVNFSSIFPAQAYPFVLEPSTLREPMQYVLDIRRWMETKHPIRFIFVGHHAAGRETEKDLNFPASIESFNWKEVAGSPGDIEYTLRLKEYVFFSARRVTPVVQPDGTTALIVEPPGRSDDRIMPDTYVLRGGEGLVDAAIRMLGDDSRWTEIQELNEIPDDQLENLPDGTEIKIPQKRIESGPVEKEQQSSIAVMEPPETRVASDEFKLVSASTDPELFMGEYLKSIGLVDYLKIMGRDSSFESRTKLAASMGIGNYTGATEQNEAILQSLRSGKDGNATGGRVGLEAYNPLYEIIYKNPDLADRTVSLVDYLEAIGWDSSFDSRAELAASMGMANYTGTAEQNEDVLQTLRNSHAGNAARGPFGSYDNVDLNEDIDEKDKKLPQEIQDEIKWCKQLWEQQEWSNIKKEIHTVVNFLRDVGKSGDDYAVLRLKTFIPSKTLYLLDDILEGTGDGRDFDVHATSSRTVQYSVINFSNIQMCTFNNTGKSHQTHPFKREGTINNDGMYVVYSLKEGIFKLNASVSSGNPLVPIANIDYNINIDIDPDKRTYSYRGTTDGFPAYEGYIRGKDGKYKTMFNISPLSEMGAKYLVDGYGDMEIQDKGYF